MLEHVMDGLAESAIITHRKSGARAVLCVRLESPEPHAEFHVREEFDSRYLISGKTDWRFAQVAGDWFRYQVVYLPQTRSVGLPTFCIDAPFQQFEIRFSVDVVHPNHAFRSLRIEEPRRA